MIDQKMKQNKTGIVYRTWKDCNIQNESINIQYVMDKLVWKILAKLCIIFFCLFVDNIFKTFSVWNYLYSLASVPQINYIHETLENDYVY